MTIRDTPFKNLFGPDCQISVHRNTIDDSSLVTITLSGDGKKWSVECTPEEAPHAAHYMKRLYGDGPDFVTIVTDALKGDERIYTAISPPAQKRLKDRIDTLVPSP